MYHRFLIIMLVGPCVSSYSAEEKHTISYVISERCLDEHDDTRYEYIAFNHKNNSYKQATVRQKNGRRLLYMAFDAPAGYFIDPFTRLSIDTAQSKTKTEMIAFSITSSPREGSHSIQINKKTGLTECEIIQGSQKKYFHLKKLKQYLNEIILDQCSMILVYNNKITQQFMDARLFKHDPDSRIDVLTQSNLAPIYDLTNK